MGSIPNLYAWQIGDVSCQKFNSAYRVAIGMIGRAGTNQSALAAKEAVRLWKPRYIIFSGIAGGLSDLKVKDAGTRLGDVVIADVIHGYEYGKIDERFSPRGNWTFRTDQGLLTGAIAFSSKETWHQHIKKESPARWMPKAIIGEIASGEKVVDDPTNEFFSQVLETWPKVKAVEMEGAGVASAIEQAQSLSIPVGFIMIRGISDLPRPKGDDQDRGNAERDAWKEYASSSAAAFTIGWIADGLPIRPSTSKRVSDS